MNQKTKYITGIVLSVLAICALTIPAFALTESDVQSQVSASGKEGVAGNLFVWFLCAVAFTEDRQLHAGPWHQCGPYRWLYAGRSDAGRAEHRCRPWRRRTRSRR